MAAKVTEDHDLYGEVLPRSIEFHCVGDSMFVSHDDDEADVHLCMEFPLPAFKAAILLELNRTPEPV